MLVKIEVTNSETRPRPLQLGFMLSGRAKNEGPENYAWSVPSVPTELLAMHKNEGLRQTIDASLAADARCFATEDGNGYAVQGVWPAPSLWERERVPTWNVMVEAGETKTFHLLACYDAERAIAEAMWQQWHGRQDDVFAQARARLGRVVAGGFYARQPAL